MPPSPESRESSPPQSTSLKEGDMVVCPDGYVGLLTVLRAIGPSSVQLRQNVWICLSWAVLRRATMAEITAAGLHGVGCNQGLER